MFKIDNMSQKPVYEQLIEQTERYILMGVINAGDAMPSVRKLSLEASVNPNTIQKAYSELTGRGVLISVPGKGCFVCGIAETPDWSNLDKAVSQLLSQGVSREEILKRIGGK